MLQDILLNRHESCHKAALTNIRNISVVEPFTGVFIVQHGALKQELNISQNGKKIPNQTCTHTKDLI